MKAFLPILSILLLLSCGSRDKKKYAEYFDFDKAPPVENLLLTKRKPNIPFANNKIYDPFVNKINGIDLQKSTFESTSKGLPKLIVLKKRITSVDISKRKRKPIYAKGLPLIIENTSKTDTLSIPLYRGKAVIVQEALNQDKEWKEIEYLTKEKLGYYQYNIFPEEFIYTKIPLYDGDFKTKLRVKMVLNDSTTIYSNTFKGFVSKRQIK